MHTQACTRTHIHTHTLKTATQTVTTPSSEVEVRSGYQTRPHASGHVTSEGDKDPGQFTSPSLGENSSSRTANCVCISFVLSYQRV